MFGFGVGCPSFHAAGGYTVSVDEKTGIQALERIHPDKPMLPGKVAKLEFEYKRHGTRALIPSYNVATGQIMAHRIGPTRKEQDFAALLKATIDAAPEAEWVLVMDQLNTHMSESVVRLIAGYIGYEGDLGLKGQRGILGCMASRKKFLSDKSHRIRIVYTPKHCSWLNQIEIWSSILTRKALRHASFPSLGALTQRITQFIEYFNQTMAKPFKWTYTGRVLQ